MIVTGVCAQDATGTESKWRPQRLDASAWWGGSGCGTAVGTAAWAVDPAGRTAGDCGATCDGLSRWTHLHQMETDPTHLQGDNLISML